ncbi:hypothetical protein I9W82_005341 [Candida metapsilosis]|uniref:Uncharacterized protein n=1 Tax=Candida metapsilosis TaxID=273372 RepID=A0A8H7ZE11_9ASCO|nr:hypothetical protein I9W82_005341 [Candida metapsilosis]
MPNTTHSTRLGHRHRVRQAPVIIKNYGPVYNAPVYHFSFPIGNLTKSPFVANDAVYDPASNTTTFTSKAGSNSSDNLVAKVVLNGNFTTETPPIETVTSDQSSSPSAFNPTVSETTVSTPTVSVPTVSETNASATAESAPNVSIATVSVPSVSVPSVSVPTESIPTESVPSVSIPTVSVPTVSAPSVSAPTVSAPTVSELPTNTTTVAANPSASRSTIGDVDIIALKASTKNFQTRMFKVLTSDKQPLNYDLVESHLKQRSEGSHNCYSSIKIPSDVKLIMKQQEQSDKDAIHLKLPAGAPRGTLKRMLEKVPQPWHIHKIIVHFNDKEFEPFEVRYFNSVFPFTKQVDPTNPVLACVSKKLDNVHFWQALRLRDELRQIHILQKKLATENWEENECPTNNEKDLAKLNGVTNYPTVVTSVYDSAENQGSVCDESKDDVKEETQVAVSVIDVDSEPQPIDNTKAEESDAEENQGSVSGGNKDDVKEENQAVVSPNVFNSDPKLIDTDEKAIDSSVKEESVPNLNVKEESAIHSNVKESAIKPNDKEEFVIVQDDNLPYVHGLSKLLDLREENFNTIFSEMVLPLLTSDWQGQLPGDEPPTFVRLEFFLTEKGKINKSYKTRCEKRLATFARAVRQHLLDMGTSQEAVLKRTLESDLNKRTFSLYYLTIQLLQTPDWKKIEPMKLMKSLMASAGKIFNSVSRFLNSLVKEFQLAVDGTEFDEQLVEKLNHMISITESEVQKVLEATVRLGMKDYDLFEKFTMLDCLPPKPEIKEVIDKQPDELNSILRQ